MDTTKKIDTLKLDKEINEILNNNNIETVYDLWILNKTNLKEIGLKDSMIKDIRIKLQLTGLDLNKKKVK